MVGGGCEAGFPKGGRAAETPGRLTGSMAPVQGWLSLDLAELEIFAGKRPKIQSGLSLHFAVGPIREHHGLYIFPRSCVQNTKHEQVGGSADASKTQKHRQVAGGRV
jgi:hypothetical protein